MPSFTFIETYPESRCRHRGPDCRWCHGLMSADLDTTLSAGLVHREVLLPYRFKMSSVIFTAPSKTFLTAQFWLNLQSSSLTFVYKHMCTQVFQAQLNSEIADWKVRAWATRYTEIEKNGKLESFACKSQCVYSRCTQSKLFLKAAQAFQRILHGRETR